MSLVAQSVHSNFRIHVPAGFSSFMNIGFSTRTVLTHVVNHLQTEKPHSNAFNLSGESSRKNS